MHECSRIKDLLTGYVKHTISLKESKEVEEHLCLCERCRLSLRVLLERSENDDIIEDRGVRSPTIDFTEHNSEDEVIGEKIDTRYKDKKIGDIIIYFFVFATLIVVVSFFIYIAIFVRR